MELYVSILLIETLLNIQYIIAYYKSKKTNKTLNNYIKNIDIINTNIGILNTNLVNINKTIPTKTDESNRINNTIELIIKLLGFLKRFFDSI